MVGTSCVNLQNVILKYREVPLKSMEILSGGKNGDRNSPVFHRRKVVSEIRLFGLHFVSEFLLVKHILQLLRCRPKSLSISVTQLFRVQIQGFSQFF